MRRRSRIIIDTNLWISFLITKRIAELDELLFTKKCVLLFSQELLDEFLEVAKRPKFRRWFSSSDILDIIDTIDDVAEFVAVKSKVSACRDEKDNFLLSLAVDGAADFLISGDQDLLALKKYKRTKIVTIADFFQL